MGYLIDNTTITQQPFYGRVADCPALYQYALIVEWVVNDRFFIPNALHTIIGKVREVLPDVEDWQCSVLRPQRRRPYIKLRFKDTATRTVASNALAVPSDPSVRVTTLTIQDPPDLANRGIA